MDRESRLTEREIDATLDSILSHEPNPYVVAIDQLGVPVPPVRGLPARVRRLPGTGTTPLHLVLPEYIEVVFRTWEEAQRRGVASAEVRLISNPELPATIHYIDTQHRYGCFLGVLIGDPVVDTGTTIRAPIRARFVQLRKDRMAVVEHADEASADVLGWPPEHLVGRRSLALIHPEDHGRAISSWLDMLSTAGATRRVRLRHQHADGSWLWFEVTNHNLLDDPTDPHILTDMIDISDEMAAQEALRANEQLLRRLTEALPLGVLQFDAEHRVIYRNKRLDSVLGVSSGQTLPDLFIRVVRTDCAALKTAIEAALVDGQDADLEISVIGEIGETRRCEVRLRPLRDGSEMITGAVASIADITRESQLRQEMEFRATYDSLTECLNRSSILEVLDQALADHTSKGVAVVFVDLDHFKNVNDERGHAAGDRLLAEVATRLRGASRGHDRLGRLGGDEFLMVCAGVPSPEVAVAVAERLARSARAPLSLDGVRYEPGLSAGVAWSAPGGSGTELVKKADEAMYEAKKSRSGGIALAS